MQDIRTIHAEEIIDPETEGHYAFITFWKATAGVHCHDFYEIFLVTGGSARHLVNHEIQELEAGSLVFIRPTDTHYYQEIGPEHLNFINLAFSTTTADRCFHYLEGCLPRETLLQTPLPPHVRLSGQSLHELTQRLQAWNIIPLAEKTAKRAELRSLLVELLIRYLSPKALPDQPDQPCWFAQLVVDMGKRDNLTAGLPALLTLSGKSHEHLCREFRRYTGQTPTAFINGLRLEFAANLLANSNLSVLDVMLTVGFENLSHFNHRFRLRYGCPPRTFRKEKHRPTAV